MTADEAEKTARKLLDIFNHNDDDHRSLMLVAMEVLDIFHAGYSQSSKDSAHILSNIVRSND